MSIQRSNQPQQGQAVNRPVDPYNNWSGEQEVLLAEWSDKAMCYRWLHDKTEKKYKRLNMIFSIPVIILSTLSGVGNFGLSSIFPEGDKTSPNLIIGGISVFTGIISTIANYLRYAQLQEAHRSCAVQWGKFQRKISVDLSMHPKDREEAHDFISACRVEYDRLMEQSPSIPKEIIAEFNSKFPTTALKIKRPEICNYLEPTRVFKVDTRVGNIVADAAHKLKNLKHEHRKEAVRREISNQGHELSEIIVDHRDLANSDARWTPTRNTVQEELKQLQNTGIGNLRRRFGGEDIPQVPPPGPFPIGEITSDLAKLGKMFGGEKVVRELEKVATIGKSEVDKIQKQISTVNKILEEESSSGSESDDEKSEKK